MSREPHVVLTSPVVAGLVMGWYVEAFTVMRTVRGLGMNHPTCHHIWSLLTLLVDLSDIIGRIR